MTETALNLQRVIFAFLAHEIEAAEFDGECISRWIEHRDAFNDEMKTWFVSPFKELSDAILFHRITDEQFALEWRKHGKDPREVFFQEMVDPIHSATMVYEVDPDPNNGEITAEELYAEVKELYSKYLEQIKLCS